MALDLTKLAGQGRAYSPMRPWTPEELDALLTLEDERDISRTVAADFIRNGIVTLEAYDKAVEASFVPKTLVEVTEAVETTLKDNAFAVAPEVATDVAPAEAVANPVAEVEPDAVAPEAEEETPPAEEATPEAAGEEEVAPKKNKK